MSLPEQSAGFKPPFQRIPNLENDLAQTPLPPAPNGDPAGAPNASPETLSTFADTPGWRTVSFFETGTNETSLQSAVAIGPTGNVAKNPGGNRAELFVVHDGNRENSSNYRVHPGRSDELQHGNTVIIVASHKAGGSPLDVLSISNALRKAMPDQHAAAPETSQTIAERLLAAHEDLDDVLVAVVNKTRAPLSTKLERRAGLVIAGAVSLMLLKGGDTEPAETLQLVGAIGTIVIPAGIGVRAIQRWIDHNNPSPARPKHPRRKAIVSLPTQRKPRATTTARPPESPERET